MGLGSLAEELKARLDNVRYAERRLGRDVDELRPYVGTLRAMVEDGLTLMLVGRHDEAQAFLRLAQQSAPRIAERHWWPAAHPNPDSPGQRRREEIANQLGKSQTLEYWCLAEWLLGEAWPTARMARAAELEVLGRNGLDPAGQSDTMQLLVNCGQERRAIELYDKCVRPSRKLALPPANGRFTLSQTNAMYVVCHHLAGTAGLGDWALRSCDSWIRRTRQWHRWDPRFFDRQRMHWMRIWQVHFGGPADVRELVASLLPRDGDGV